MANSRIGGSLRYMKNHLVVWGQKWCPSKNARRSSAGRQGQILADGTYTLVPKLPTTRDVSLTSTSRPRGIAGSVPDEPLVRVPPPSSYPQPPALEDAEWMFDTSARRRDRRPRTSNDKNVRRLRSRTNRHSLPAKDHSLPAGDGPRRGSEPSPALGTSMEPNPLPLSGMGASRDLIPSHNESDGNMLPMVSPLSFPSEEDLYMCRPPDPLQYYSFLDFPLHSVDTSSTQSQLPAGMREGPWDYNISSTDFPCQNPAPMSFPSYYDEIVPFRIMSANSMHPFPNDAFGSPPIPVDQAYTFEAGTAHRLCLL